MNDGGSASMTFGDLLLVLATWILRGCAAWGALMVVATLVEAATHGRVHASAWVATPTAVRRTLLTALGILLAAAAPGPVSAAVASGSQHRPEPWSLPVPERPEGQLRAPTVRVRAGDTLWALAAAHLPRGAGDAVVLAAVHRWYSRNHRRIGADPDLLRPGQRLSPPRSHDRPAQPPTEESP
jgi:hypothetical protein